MKSLPIYYSPSLVKYTSPPPHPRLSIRGNIPNVNKILKEIFQNSCSENCQQSHGVERSRSFNFIPSPSINLLDQLKIVLARNIGHVSDISYHEVLFYN